MRTLIQTLLRFRPLMVVILVAWIAAGLYMFSRLDIEAYPDPSPPLVEIITQNPVVVRGRNGAAGHGASRDGALSGFPHLQYIRSISIFGSERREDVLRLFDTDYFTDRQEVLNRLQTCHAAGKPAAAALALVADRRNLSLPPRTARLFPERTQGHAGLAGAPRNQTGSRHHRRDHVRRHHAAVPGGGRSPALLQYNLTLPQVVAAVAASNANVGGNYITLGSQSVNVRGIGLLRSIDDMGNVVVAERNGAPVYLRRRRRTCTKAFSHASARSD